MKSSRDRGSAGFSLIEALVVLAVSGLVVMTLAIATSLMVRGWGRAATQSNAIEGLTTGLAVVRRDLEGAQRFHWGTPDAGGALFSGGRSAVGIVVGRDGTAPGAGDSLVWIEARYDDKGGALVRSAAPLFPEMTGFVAAGYGAPVTLMSGQWTFRFSYGNRTGAGISWRETWTDAQKMPASIRLEVLETQTGLSVVPPLVVPLRVDAEPGCVGSAAYCSLTSESAPADNSATRGGGGTGTGTGVGN